MNGKTSSWGDSPLARPGNHLSAARTAHAPAQVADHVEVDSLRHLLQHPVEVFQRSLAVAVLEAGQGAQAALTARILWRRRDDRVEVAQRPLQVAVPLG